MSDTARATDELVALGTELIEAAGRRGSGLRLLGGVAFWLNSPRGREVASLSRPYKDLDFAAVRKGSRVLPDVFARLGWEADARFNALHGATRLLFFHGGDLQADIFLGSFEQCHRLEFGARILRQPLTLPLGELLLTKLQVRQLNEKDAQDTLSLLLDHDFGQEMPAELPELDTIARVVGAEWGWYTTCLDSLVSLGQAADRLLSGPERDVAVARLEWIRDAIEQAPKSRRWRLRSMVGRRWPWYEEPEEVNR